MEQFDNYIDFLQVELKSALSFNPSFSQRAFKLLGMSPGSLSEITAGKRKLTIKNALKNC